MHLGSEEKKSSELEPTGLFFCTKAIAAKKQKNKTDYNWQTVLVVRWGFVIIFTKEDQKTNIFSMEFSSSIFSGLLMLKMFEKLKRYACRRQKITMLLDRKWVFPAVSYCFLYMSDYTYIYLLYMCMTMRSLLNSLFNTVSFTVCVTQWT